MCRGLAVVLAVWHREIAGGFWMMRCVCKCEEKNLDTKVVLREHRRRISDEHWVSDLDDVARPLSGDGAGVKVTARRRRRMGAGGGAENRHRVREVMSGDRCIWYV
ncbi:hypothetical protein F4604DRAFT_1784409 [Suillus subluteus]|nr:hypothetical protein F4604DRAFT_1784409 [Suillus subluteus]